MTTYTLASLQISQNKTAKSLFTYGETFVSYELADCKFQIHASKLAGDISFELKVRKFCCVWYFN